MSINEVLQIIQIVITVAVIPIAWHYTTFVSEFKKLKGVVVNCQLELAQNYINKADFKDDLHRIETQLDQIYQLLQNKQDK